MKLTTRQIIESIGLFSIVASLIFVGVQLRLDGRIALAEVYSMRTESRRADLRAILESEIALSELSEYRQRSLLGQNYSLPESWINDDDPRISEARRIRIELAIVGMDGIIYNRSLGLYGDLGPLRATVKSLFTDDPGAMDYALRGILISEYTRSLFIEVATEIEND